MPASCIYLSMVKGDSIYLHVLGRPAGDVIRVLALDRPVLHARILATGAELCFTGDRAHPRDAVRNPPHVSPLKIHLPMAWLDPYATVLEVRLGPVG